MLSTDPGLVGQSQGKATSESLSCLVISEWLYNGVINFGAWVLGSSILRQGMTQICNNYILLECYRKRLEHVPRNNLIIDLSLLMYH